MDNTVAGVIGVPIIVALVQLAKSVGLDGRWAVVLAVVLGLVAVVSYAAVTPGSHDGMAWYQAVAGGLAEGLAAAGLYSGTKALTTESRRPPRPSRG